MAKKIAFAGTGGVGKSVLASAFAFAASDHRVGENILLIDADPDQSLAYLLGMGSPPEQTIASAMDRNYSARTLRDEGCTADELFARTADQAIIPSEESGVPFDFIAMGAPRGRGCYCAPNAALKNYMDHASIRYDLIIVDSPGGREQLARARMEEIDLLVVVQRDDLVSRQRALQIIQSVYDTDVEVGSLLVVNNMTPNMPPDHVRLRTVAVPVDGGSAWNLDLTRSTALEHSMSTQNPCVGSAWPATHIYRQVFGDLLQALVPPKNSDGWPPLELEAIHHPRP